MALTSLLSFRSVGSTFGLMLFAFSIASLNAETPAAPKTPPAPPASVSPADKLKENLLAQYQKNYALFVSDKEEEGRQAMLRMLPTKPELQSILGPNAEIIWPNREQLKGMIENHYEKITSELRKYGPIVDIRIEPPVGSAIEVLKKKVLLPKDLPVFGIRLEFENLVTRIGPFAYVNNRWVTLPDLLEIVISPSFTDRQKQRIGLKTPLPENASSLITGRWKRDQDGKTMFMELKENGEVTTSLLKNDKELSKTNGEWILESSELRLAFSQSADHINAQNISFHSIQMLTPDTMVLAQPDGSFQSYVRVTDVASKDHPSNPTN
jgi:hypothetical protein